ncbi:cyclin-like protein [Thamnocephalis sphaerospora]|uniref:B-related factor 1 n=1 Tax=Thamnocephalis sphaerospora TaxID=78915 RepID=A0A4P9XPW4_9FUNG|nr:cyclin-like protein [Thamnocephalis sphaerospora]|eukprot:RKP08064.1 cyclin-like protein [Thamnocephalis sphaerospora]
MPCKGCGGNTFEHDDAQGNAFCVQCGVVFEENTLAKEVEFGEKSNGAAVLMGSYVSAGQGRAISFGSNRRQATLESKEQSIANGRRHIQALATALRISERYVEAAQRYFNLALAYNFTRGRTTQSVTAACLYVACRMERTSHMLIDFSDVLQVNVFSLGNTFLKLVKELNLRLPLVDPSIYIHRFAAMLDFGDMTPTVATDALRLVQRMGRDWIQTGRRPAGICGACLLIAARMHSFRRTRSEVMRVVKIGDATLKRRLHEFMATPSGKLSMADFQTISLEDACDPPAFTHGKQNPKAGVSPAIAMPADAIANATEVSTKFSGPEIDENVENWSDIDDEEISCVFLTESEVVEKTEMWEETNRDYLEKLAGADDCMYRRKRGDPPVDESAQTAAEAAKKMLSAKKYSRKINYAVIDVLFDGEPSESTAESVTADNVEASTIAADVIKYEVVEEPGVVTLSVEASATAKNVASSVPAGAEEEEEEEEDDDEEEEELVHEQDVYNSYDDAYDEYND